MELQTLLGKACDLSEEELAGKRLFFKTIGMSKWEELDSAAYSLS